MILYVYLIVLLSIHIIIICVFFLKTTKRIDIYDNNVYLCNK